MAFDSKNALFKLKSHTLVCRLIEGNYPNYNAVIPSNNPNKVLVDRIELVNGIKRVAVCSNPTTNLIRMDIADNRITLTAQDIDFSVSANETISCSYDGQPISIGFKSTFLVEILSNMDTPTVVVELADSTRAGVDVDFKRRKFIDVQNIFHKKEQRTLVAAYKFYCDKDLEEAHSAEADTKATYEVLKAQLDRYDDLENDIDKLAEYSCRAELADYAGRILYNEKGEEVFGFGKYKGRSVAEVFRIEPSYYAWMMNGDFPLYTKKVITEIRMRDKMK